MYKPFPNGWFIYYVDRKVVEPPNEFSTKWGEIQLSSTHLSSSQDIPLQSLWNLYEIPMKSVLNPIFPNKFNSFQVRSIVSRWDPAVFLCEFSVFRARPSIAQDTVTTLKGSWRSFYSDQAEVWFFIDK